MGRGMTAVSQSYSENKRDGPAPSFLGVGFTLTTAILVTGQVKKPIPDTNPVIPPLSHTVLLAQSMLRLEKKK